MAKCFSVGLTRFSNQILLRLVLAEVVVDIRAGCAFLEDRSDPSLH
jgi:hypothetical protein